MSKSHLLPCSSCSRHVRVSESSCPHCGVATTDEFRSRVAPRLPGKRLKRAALFAVGIGSATVGVAACSDAEKDPCEGLSECYASPAYGIAVDAAEPIPDPDDASDASTSTDATGDAEPDAMFVVDAGEGGTPPDSSM